MEIIDNSKENQENSLTLLSNRSKRMKKQNIIEDLGYIGKKKERPKNKSKFDSEDFIKSNVKTANTALNILKLLKKEEGSDAFFSKTCELSLHFLEKQIKNKEKDYNTILEFGVEVRKYFTSLFQNSTANADNYTHIFAFSSKFEEIYKKYETENHDDFNKILELKKKINRMNKELNSENTTVITKSNTEKRISDKKKLRVIHNLKFLNDEEIKGVVGITSNVLEFNQKHLEFDVMKLSENKLKELEKYINRCLKKSKYTLTLNYYKIRSLLTLNLLQSLKNLLIKKPTSPLVNSTLKTFLTNNN